MIARLFALWATLSVALSSGSLALMLILLVHRFSKNLEEVITTWWIIGGLIALTVGAILLLREFVFRRHIPQTILG